MPPLYELVVHKGPIEPEEAERIMVERKVKKLPLMNGDGTLLGLVTSRDLVRDGRLVALRPPRRLVRPNGSPFATRDAQGRLRVGAAIGATGDYLERAAELLKTGVDVLVIDISHGHSGVMDKAIASVRKRFGDVELIAGNVATAAGTRFL